MLQGRPEVVRHLVEPLRFHAALDRLHSPQPLPQCPFMLPHWRRTSMSSSGNATLATLSFLASSFPSPLQAQRSPIPATLLSMVVSAPWPLPTLSNPNTLSKCSRLSFVDLAGSERVKKSCSTENQLKEAQSINKSLSALGDVISALCSEGQHIPYRNHKLTMLMSDSLGGNAKTLMFVNASPAESNLDETYNSLVYASRVRCIVNDPSKNISSKEIARLKKLVTYWKDQAGKRGDDEELEEIQEERALGERKDVQEDRPSNEKKETQEEKPSRERKETQEEKPPRERKGMQDERQSKERKGMQEEKQSKERKGIQEEKPSRERKEMQEEKASRERKEMQEERQTKERKGMQDEKQPKERKEAQDEKLSRERKEIQEGRQSKERKGVQEERQSRERKEVQEERPPRERKDIQEERQPREKKGMQEEKPPRERNDRRNSRQSV
ncbi:hypothetical protein KSP39_PZI011778 [Platanthera zijinensis]|uniref:Kinesin-like protein n=1 Tax=Platanthera zijinensis TaxID=2320716 RepID=A0AAP0BDS6_9ASPA